MNIIEQNIKGKPEDIVRTYVKQYLHEDKNNLYYQESTADV
jgi:hypothetical protein